MDPLRPAVASASADALDGSILHELVESMVQPSAVAAVYRKFVENAATFIAELPAQDPAARVDTLHTLKGSAAMMGAKCLAQVAADLQSQAQNDSIQVAQAMARLEAELARFRSAAATQLRAIGVSLEG